MDTDESLALFAQGRDAWNAWAAERIAERAALEAVGQWTPGWEERAWNDPTRAWHAAARADFSGHEFKDSVDFSGFVFPCDAIFREAAFSGESGFAGSTFSSRADFGGVTFAGSANFNVATFSSHVIFGTVTFLSDALFAAEFLGDAWFAGTAFSGEGWFHGARFSGSAAFHRAEFSGDAVFSTAKFAGDAGFQWVKFSGDAKFGEARFSEKVWFPQARFEGFALFDSVRFEDAADFSAIVGKSVFSLAGASFLAVPDFTHADLSEAPRFDDCRIEPRGLRRTLLVNLNNDLKGDRMLSVRWAVLKRLAVRHSSQRDRNIARWRALKRLAVQGRDHRRALEFFGNEIKSRRWTRDRPWHAVFWFGLFYGWFSDFGRSLARPLLWWVASVAVCARLYLEAHLARARQPGSCVEGIGEPWIAALELSLRKGLLLLGTGSADRSNQLYGCLYGMFSDAPAGLGQYTQAYSPIVPDGVAFLGLGQLLLSAVLFALLLLALRNRFRIT